MIIQCNNTKNNQKAEELNDKETKLESLLSQRENKKV